MLSPIALHGDQIRKRRVQRPGCPHAFGEPKMPMVRERLVARQRRVGVGVRKRQHRLPRRLARLRAHVEIHPHPLHGARRRVVEREVVDLSGFALILRARPAGRPCRTACRRPFDTRHTPGSCGSRAPRKTCAAAGTSPGSHLSPRRPARGSWPSTARASRS